MCWQLRFFFSPLIFFFLLGNASFPFQAGLSSEALHIPVGVPTAGYAQMRGGDDPGSPFALKFPATQGIHTPLKVKVLYLKTKTESMSLIKLDTVGVDLHLYDELEKKIAENLGAEAKTHILLLTGSHTHAGPGRLGRNPAFWVATDTYSEWLFQYLLEQIFSAWKKAKKNLFEAKIGMGVVELGEIIHDRRCENPEDKDPLMRIVRIDDKRGKMRAALLNLGIHGTVLSSSNHFFSVDAPGMIELKIEEEVGFPFIAFHLQGTAGDISPRTPLDHGNPWDNLEQIGATAAEKVLPALQEIKTSPALSLRFASLRVPLSREELGYGPEEFLYPYGAMLCGMGKSACDDDFTTPLPSMKSCPLSDKKYLFSETFLTGVAINDWLLLSFPGEPTTPLGKALRQKIKDELKTEKVFLLGYAQDHLGYLLLSWDWWQGGYEPSMSPWGWKLGDFLSNLSFALARHLVKRAPLPAIAFSASSSHPEKTVQPPLPEEALEAGSPFPEEGLKDNGKEITFRWYGGDGFTDLPKIYVEMKKNNGWQLFRSSLDNQPLTEAHFSLFLHFHPVPAYREEKELSARHFIWTLTWRYARPVSSPFSPLSGTYRFKIKGQSWKEGKVIPYTLISPVFELKLQ